MPANETFNVYGLLTGTLAAKLRVRLHTSPSSEGGLPVLQDFVPATFFGYREQELKWHAPAVVNVGARYAARQSEILYWECDAPDGPENSIKGFYIVAWLPDNSEALVGYRQFGAPIVMGTPGKRFAFNVTLSVRQVEF